MCDKNFSIETENGLKEAEILNRLIKVQNNIEKLASIVLGEKLFSTPMGNFESEFNPSNIEFWERINELESRIEGTLKLLKKVEEQKRNSEDIYEKILNEEEEDSLNLLHTLNEVYSKV